MDSYKFETLQIHAGQSHDPVTGAVSVPIYQTSGYVFESCDYAASLFNLEREGNIYTRIMNPTNDVFEKRMTALEGGTGALATASGQSAALITVFNLAKAGDHIICAKAIYGGTYNLFANTFKDYGIETSFVDADDPAAFEHAIKENTKLIFIEPVTNPNAGVVDVEAVADVAHKHRIPLVTDNTFTPYLFQPFKHGADIIIHSATKYIDGHGSSTGGVIIDGGRFDWEGSGKFPRLTEPDPSYHNLNFSKTFGKELAFITRARVCLLRDLGPCLSPFHSFLFLQGLETLSLRMERHADNAYKAAKFLSINKNIEKVTHPSLPGSPYIDLVKKYFPKGPGAVFSAVIKGGKEGAKSFIAKLKLFSLVANLGDVKSLVIHPASTTHSQMSDTELINAGISPGAVRFSIGTEHIDDIIADLQQALE